MKVFISWSGQVSKSIAIIFREWLPAIIQSVTPYMSSEDIDKGARWSSDLAKELEDTNYGIICVTKENCLAPWLHYEAGALSKTINRSYVSPFLYNIKPSEIDGPLLQFQSTIFQKEDIYKLLKSINRSCGESALDEKRLEKLFELTYPRIESDLKSIVQQSDSQIDISPKTNTSNDAIEEILEISRINQILIKDLDRSTTKDILLSREMNYEELRYCSQEIRRAIKDMENIKKQYGLRAKVDYSELIRYMGKYRVETRDEREVYESYILYILSFLVEEHPWIYIAGEELMNTIKKAASISVCQDAVASFREKSRNAYEISKLMGREIEEKTKHFIEIELPQLIAPLISPKAMPNWAKTIKKGNEATKNIFNEMG